MLCSNLKFSLQNYSWKCFFLQPLRFILLKFSFSRYTFTFTLLDPIDRLNPEFVRNVTSKNFDPKKRKLDEEIGQPISVISTQKSTDKKNQPETSKHLTKRSLYQKVLPNSDLNFLCRICQISTISSVLRFIGRWDFRSKWARNSSRSKLCTKSDYDNIEARSSSNGNFNSDSGKQVFPNFF